ncbi:hypothetical protein AeMF1_013629 [Aphanomyces euteiches]|nr:hypothetical protein AeMF1_013629 [Aphanomyces euteiches]
MQSLLDHGSNGNATAVSRKWTATQKTDSKRKVAPPTSDDYSEWTVDQLNLECTQRKLDVAKGTNKEGRVNVLNMYDENTAAVTALVHNQRVGHRKMSKANPDDRRKAGSMLRLVNVLFSDELFEEFMSTGDRLTRKQLDEGGHKFWTRAADEFNAAKPEYDLLLSNDDRVSALDPSDGGILSATKLCMLWKELSSLFANAVAKSKVSGQYSSSFWSFCDKRVDDYYLHLATEARNAGREFCSSNLFVQDEFDSIDKEDMLTLDSTPSKRKRSSSPAVKQDEIMATIAKSVTMLAESDQKHSARETCFESITRLETSIERVSKRLVAIESELHELERSGHDAADLLDDRKRLKLHQRQLELKLEEIEKAWIC